MQKRSSIVGGAIMIIVGLLFLGLQMFPSLASFFDMAHQWPLIVIVVGIFFLFGAFAGTPPLAIPGSIVTGIGSILYYQNLTGNWDSWAYIWSLIPGFIGIGLILSARLGSREPNAVASGKRLILISAVLFIAFTAFFSGFSQFWPVVLIAVGIWLLLKNRRSVRAKSEDFI